MKSVEKFTVEIRSGFDQWWRYNAALMCGAFDASGNRIGFASAESRVAEMGSNLEAPPEGLDLHRSLTLETVPCERIVLYIYVIPHTLPRDNEIGGHPPFPLQVRIRYGDRTVLDKEYSIRGVDRAQGVAAVMRACGRRSMRLWPQFSDLRSEPVAIVIKEVLQNFGEPLFIRVTRDYLLLYAAILPISIMILFE